MTMISLTVDGKGKVDVEEGTNVFELLKQMNIHPDEVIVLSEGRPLPEDEVLVAGQSLRIVSVVSGG